jgi:lipid-A-disaccharide synthase
LSSPSILILTGEPSGDLAGGKLARALRGLNPNVRLDAVGGASLREAGANILFDISDLGAMGLVAILRQFPRLKRLEDDLRQRLDTDPPDALVCIDYPGFNLRIARLAKERGVRVVWYISPQVWAWGAGRVPRIAESVDRMLVVFPFEEDLYRDAGLRTDFVGHPLLDDLADAPGRGELRTELGLDDDVPVLGLLAGSRVQEVRRLFPIMLATAREVQTRVPGLQVVASVASSVPRAEYERWLGTAPADGFSLCEGPAGRIITGSDALLVTSGTATLESGLLGTPLAVLYRTTTLEWLVGKGLVRIPRIALVNIVAGEDVAPEFLQRGAKPAAIADWAAGILQDPGRAAAARSRLSLLRDRLGEPGASDRTAAIVLEEAAHK